jgi:hypothetical protein
MTLLPSNLFTPVLQNVTVANLPQLVVSFAYIFYNGLLTNMTLSREFTIYAAKRCGLRVSSPKGSQRSTFWLSLPYRYSIPLLAFSVLLHWLVSQTLFVSEIQVRDPSGEIDLSYSVNGVGFSPQGLVVLISVSLAMLVFPILIGLQRYPCGVPLVRSNSLAISAACVKLPGKHREEEKLLKYGYIGRDLYGNKLVGFSSGRVEPLSSAIG